MLQPDQGSLLVGRFRWRFAPPTRHSHVSEKWPSPYIQPVTNPLPPPVLNSSAAMVVVMPGIAIVVPRLELRKKLDPSPACLCATIMLAATISGSTFHMPVV